MHVVGVVQARYHSTRLPGKVLLDICGKPMVIRVYDRLRRWSRALDDVVIAIPNDDNKYPGVELRHALQDLCIKHIHAGRDYDIVTRLLRVGRVYDADAIVRITGDCPLIDPKVVDLVVWTYKWGSYDYVSNVDPPSFPDGLDVEIYSMDLLRRLDRDVPQGTPSRETFMYDIWDGGYPVAKTNVCLSNDLSHLRWTVDYEEDLEFVRRIYSELGIDCSMQEVLDFLVEHPEVQEINAMYSRPVGLPEHDRVVI